MENNTEKIDNVCIVCGSTQFDFFANKNNFNLYKCKNCGLIFVWPIPQSVADLYSQDYFDGAKYGFGYVNYEEDKSAMSKTFDLYLKKIEQFTPMRGKILDIGAATGFFIKLAIVKGWEASGVEISEYAAKTARKKGLDVFNGTLKSANFDSASFDVVTLWDAIEHLTDPLGSVKMIHYILKEGGIIAINTPDSTSLIAKILGKRWHLLVPPEHLVIFNQKNLSTLFKSCGFDILWIGKAEKKFTLQYALQVASNKLNSNLIWRMAEFFKNNLFGKISVPINLKDNFLVIAKKT